MTTAAMQTRIWGLLAEFRTPEELIEAAGRVKAAGYERADAYSPFPVEGLADALGFKRTTVPVFVLVAGICGALGGFFMCYYANVFSYPYNVGGRPYNSWPYWIPITFECTVLLAGLTSLTTMLVLNGLPQHYHPLFNVADFDLASRDKFFISIEASDPKFESERTRQFLEGLNPAGIFEVPR